jgi:hypothetical protein
MRGADDPPAVATDGHLAAEMATWQPTRRIVIVLPANWPPARPIGTRAPSA